MSNFILSGFADEIDPMVNVQIDAMKQFGIGYIEMRGVNGQNIADCTLEEIEQTARQCHEADMRISAVGSPLGKIKIQDDMEAHMAQFEDLIKKAKILETPYIRVFSFYLPQEEPPETYRDEVLRRMQRMVKKAKESGVILLHENEKDIYGDIAERCLDLFESIGSDHLWATFDPANFVQCGCEPYPHAYDLLKDYIRYIHIKDAKEDGSVVPAGEGKGNISALLYRLKQDGYKGFLSLEPHLGDFIGFSDLEGDAAQQKKPKSGAETFKIAVDACNTILKGVESNG